VCAGSVLTACRARRVAEGGSEYDYRSVTSSPKSTGLLSYFSTSFLFHLLPLLTCTAVQYILSDPLTTDKFMVSYLGQYHCLVPILYGEESFCSAHIGQHGTM